MAVEENANKMAERLSINHSVSEDATGLARSTRRSLSVANRARLQEGRQEPPAKIGDGPPCMRACVVQSTNRCYPRAAVGAAIPGTQTARVQQRFDHEHEPR